MEEMLKFFETHPGTASWVQAVGSVLALVITIALAQFQLWATRRHYESQIKSRQVQMFDAFGGICNFIGIELDNLARGMHRYPQEYLEEVYQPVTIQTALATMDNFPFFELPEHEHVSTALRIRDACHICLRFSNNAITDWKEGNFAHSQHNVEELKKALEYLTTQVEIFSGYAISTRG